METCGAVPLPPVVGDPAEGDLRAGRHGGARGDRAQRRRHQDAGQWFQWRDIPVMVTYHPSFLLRAYNQNAKREAWEDLKKVLHFVYD